MELEPLRLFLGCSQYISPQVQKYLIALDQPLDLPGVPERASPHPGLPNDDTLQKRPKSEVQFQTSDFGNALSRTDCLQNLIQGIDYAVRLDQEVEVPSFKRAL